MHVYGGTDQGAIADAIQAAGGVTALLALLSRQGEQQDQALIYASWLLSDLTHSPRHCKAMIEAGFVAAFTTCFEGCNVPGALEGAGWALANIAIVEAGTPRGGRHQCGRPPPGQQHDNVLSTAATLLCNVASNDGTKDAVVSAAGVPPLVGLLQHCNPSVAAAAARDQSPVHLGPWQLPRPHPGSRRGRRHRPPRACAGQQQPCGRHHAGGHGSADHSQHPARRARLLGSAGRLGGRRAGPAALPAQHAVPRRALEFGVGHQRPPMC